VRFCNEEKRGGRGLGAWDGMGCQRDLAAHERGELRLVRGGEGNRERGRDEEKPGVR